MPKDPKWWCVVVEPTLHLIVDGVEPTDERCVCGPYSTKAEAENVAEYFNAKGIYTATVHDMMD